MRRVAGVLLVLFVFTIPWEYSLDIGAPFGNVARIAGLFLLLVAVPVVLMSGEMRRPGPLQWLSVGLFLWFCVTFFWSAVPDVTLMKLRGYAQEMMIVWLIWEFAETPGDLRTLMRAWFAGSSVLAILTLANFILLDPASPDQIRFAAVGQDPNDVARFLDLGFPIAALLLDGRETWLWKLLAVAYLPLGFACVLLTASRGGFVAAVVALAGSGLLLAWRNPKGIFVGAAGLSAVVAMIGLIAPRGMLARIASITEPLENGDLNQRVNIWSSGWHAFLKAPLFGHGAGSFVATAGLAPIDTAHNTILSILVEGGLCSLALAMAIVAVSMRSIVSTRGALRIALMTLMAVWFVSSLVGTVGESRTTWLLLGIVALSHRLIEEQPDQLERDFSISTEAADLQFAERFQ